MFEKVANLLSEYFSVSKDSITQKTDIVADLGADSLAVVELLFTLEDETGIIVPDDMVDKLAVVGDLVAFLEKN